MSTVRYSKSADGYYYSPKEGDPFAKTEWDMKAMAKVFDYKHNYTPDILAVLMEKIIMAGKNYVGLHPKYYQMNYHRVGDFVQTAGSLKQFKSYRVKMLISPQADERVFSIYLGAMDSIGDHLPMLTGRWIQRLRCGQKALDAFAMMVLNKWEEGRKALASGLSPANRWEVEWRWMMVAREIAEDYPFSREVVAAFIATKKSGMAKSLCFNPRISLSREEANEVFLFARKDIKLTLLQRGVIDDVTVARAYKKASSARTKEALGEYLDKTATREKMIEKIKFIDLVSNPQLSRPLTLKLRRKTAVTLEEGAREKEDEPGDSLTTG